MLVSLQKGVVEYLSDKFPSITVSRSYSPRASMTDIQAKSDAGEIHVVVAPPSQTGEDIPASRSLVKRVVGIDVSMIIKPNSWNNDVIDPFLEQSEEIRRTLWYIPPVEISNAGYDKAVFVRLDDQFCGIPEDMSRLFVAIITPHFQVNCKV